MPAPFATKRIAMNDTITIEPWESNWECLGRDANFGPTAAASVSASMAFLHAVVCGDSNSVCEVSWLEADRVLYVDPDIHEIETGLALSPERFELFECGFRGLEGQAIDLLQSSREDVIRWMRAREIEPRLDDFELPARLDVQKRARLPEYGHWIANTIRFFDAFAWRCGQELGHGIDRTGKLVQRFVLDDPSNQAEYSLALHLDAGSNGIPSWRARLSTDANAELPESLVRGYRVLRSDGLVLELDGEKLLAHPGARSQTEMIARFSDCVLRCARWIASSQISANVSS